MTQKAAQYAALSENFRTAALLMADERCFDHPLGDWPVHTAIASPRRFQAFVDGIAEAARETNPQWFITRDEGKNRITTAILVMKEAPPTVAIPVRFTRKAVKIDRTIIALTVPHAGALILDLVIHKVTNALLSL